MDFSDIMKAFEPFEPKPIPGYVYAVQFDDGLVKIGSTANASQRFYTLQYNYRNKSTRIVKTYISDYVNDSRGAERKAQHGLKAVEKREVYKIRFGDACRRIKKATGTKDDFITLSRKQTEEEFPFLIPTWERYERAVNQIISLAKTL